MKARKRYGQHFLEPAWVAKVVAAIAPAPGDRLFEIGPGRGALTLALAPRVARLVAIEVDRDLAADLAPQLPPHATLVIDDVLEADLQALLLLSGASPARPFRVAANLPYNISSPVLFRLIDLAAGGLVSDATLMLQREVAERLVATPGTRDYGPLSVAAGLWSDRGIVLHLPPGAFRPMPRVDSAVVRLRFRREAGAPRPAAVVRLARHLFLHRRKMIGNALGGAPGLGPRPAREVIEAAGLDPRARPETLSIDALARIVEALDAAPPVV
ncbi:MAG: ribosomal RNA small subunit methyltransferase A [Vicinamibacteraceae bacterium]|nr:ribosomal RNA small subunit methyltransferase A [Vicinamibacteraceae bacterium]